MKGKITIIALSILILIPLALSSQTVTNVLDYGAKGDKKTENTTAFRKALQEVAKTKGVLRIPGGDYLLSAITIEADSITIEGPGTLITHNIGRHDILISIKGNGNVIKNLNFFEKEKVKSLLTINGSYNKVLNSTFDTAKKSNSKIVVYSDRLLNFSSTSGVGNMVDSSSFNNGRVGVAFNGSFTLSNSHISNNIMGVLLKPSSRNAEISNNKIEYNDVTHKGGNDGILGQRNVDNIHIHDNEVSHSGEHGIYFQGSNSLIENNKVHNNYKSGIKLASYNTQLYNWPDNKYYIGHNNVIKNNEIYNNSDKPKTNAGIYLQAPLKDISVLNNKIYNNYHGIRSTSVYKKRKDDRTTTLQNLKFIDNKLINNKGISLWIEAEKDILVEGNTGHKIYTNTKSKSVRIKGFIFRDNQFKEKTLNWLESPVIKN